MNNLDILLQEFDELIGKVPDGSVMQDVTGNKFCIMCGQPHHKSKQVLKLRAFITKAYYLGLVTGAERMADESKLKIKEVSLSNSTPRSKTYLHAGYNDAVNDQEVLAKKALKQIKQQQVLNTIKKEANT